MTAIDPASSVNPDLTPDDTLNVRRAHNGKGRKKSVEHSLKWGAASIIRSQARRVDLDEFDLPDLAALRALHDVIELAMGEAARALNDRGHSWADIARELGLTRQAVHAAYARRTKQ